ncbi:unnamed protein product [Phaeothamnion confervicola]
MVNAFSLLVFAKMVEEDLGAIGLLLCFLICGAASGAISLVLLPKNTSSKGASGAVFGLYAVAVLSKMLPGGGRPVSWRGAVDVAVFGSFVGMSLVHELQMVASGGGGTTSHVAHLAGILAGALLVLLLRRVLPGMGSDGGTGSGGGDGGSGAGSDGGGRGDGSGGGGPVWDGGSGRGGGGGGGPAWDGGSGRSGSSRGGGGGRGAATPRGKGHRPAPNGPEAW